MCPARDGEPPAAGAAIGVDVPQGAALEVAIVVYRPVLDELRACLLALDELRGPGAAVVVHLWHCDAGPQDTPGLPELLRQLQAAGTPLKPGGGAGNLGFGRAINALSPGLAASHLLILNQDAIPEPGALTRLWHEARHDDPRVAAWELRQIPYEHPKDYDPATGETGWFSGAAVLLRTDALRAVGGFEPRFFMYCEDVDLSWRLRCAGWRLRYLPQCAVVHRTYEHAGQVKPLAALQGYYANLCLRTRFAGRRCVREGIGALLREMRGRQPFAGRRRGIVTALLKFARDDRYFRRTRRAASDFEPCFNGWDYEQRREGAFHAFRAQAERQAPLPAATVLLRARGDAQALEEALRCIAGQTHAPLEIIVVGGTEPALHPVCSAWATRLPLRPLAEPPSATLQALAVVHAQADWWLILEDERTRLYADHLEVLLQAALDQGRLAAVSLTWLIEAEAADHAAAHRRHAPRQTLAGLPATRPTRLLHRNAPADPVYAEVEKTTAVCYAGSPAG
ncbi:MAG: hypothetical protein ABS84_01900 [Rubrivivax sp. SCN 71-131]|nr:MAG: hypothetical protein ABS84_01900 [Rubrivivax sp. SCN 71-131]